MQAGSSYLSKAWRWDIAVLTPDVTAPHTILGVRMSRRPEWLEPRAGGPRVRVGCARSPHRAGGGGEHGGPRCRRPERRMVMDAKEGQGMTSRVHADLLLFPPLPLGCSQMVPMDGQLPGKFKCQLKCRQPLKAPTGFSTPKHRSC